MTGPVASRPAAVLISGDPATGKTTLGTRLARRMGAAVLDLDVVTGPLTDIVAARSGVTDLSDADLAGLTRAARYATLFDVAEANIRSGLSVVLIAPFTSERRNSRTWADVRDRLESAGADVTLVWLFLAADDLLARLGARAADRDVAKIANPDAYLRGLERSAPVGPHLALDATVPVEGLMTAVLRQLGR